MDVKEKVLYHQIHPAKLLTDTAVGIITLSLLWSHYLLWTVVALVPSPVVSFVIIRYVNLEPYKNSAFGHYIGRYMTPAMQAIRLIGYLIAATGAWLHLIWLIVIGLLTILSAWFRGLLLPNR